MNTEFTEDLKKVLLIKKLRPDWQKNRYNAPGGHIEEKECALACVKREFKEECNYTSNSWKGIGTILNRHKYRVDIFADILNCDHCIKSLTDEKLKWFDVDKLPKNCISNLYWLIPYAINFYNPEEKERIYDSTFLYENIKK